MRYLVGVYEGEEDQSLLLATIEVEAPDKHEATTKAVVELSARTNLRLPGNYFMKTMGLT